MKTYGKQSGLRAFPLEFSVSNLGVIDRIEGETIITFEEIKLVDPIINCPKHNFLAEWLRFFGSNR